MSASKINDIDKISSGDLEAMQLLLVDSIAAKWGKEQLPDSVQLIREASEQFNLELKVAQLVVKGMLDFDRKTLLAMGYYDTRFGLQPPVYKG
jgi:hypothetical protein